MGKNNTPIQNQIELLKSNNQSKKTGKVFTNLYLRINGGTPIAIDMVKYNGKLRGLLLAVAKEANIKTVTQVIEESF